MHKFITYIKSHKIITFGLTLITIITILLAFISQKAPPSLLSPTPPGPTPKSESHSSWQGIKPNQTSLKEVIALLGEPSAITQQADSTVYEYESTLPGYNHTIYFKNDTATLIREQSEITIQKKITDILPNPASLPSIKYTKEYGEGTPLYIYPLDGIAFITDNQGQHIYETWHFNPDTIENIIQTWQEPLSIVEHEKVESQF